MSEPIQLILFYDGHCPLCVKEIALLRQRDHRGLLQLEDIHAPDFCERYPQLDPLEAEKILHGLDASGQWLRGLDVTVKAWQLVNHHRWLGMTRWPLIRPVADMAYRFFARHRKTIARLLTGRRHCERCIDGEQ